VETKELASKIEAAVPGSVLEMRPFGRGKALSVWIEMQALIKVGQWLKEDQELALDWLENLSAMDIDGTLVFTYFLRSKNTPTQLILRGSVVPLSVSDIVTVPSVESVWPMAKKFEREIADLFGAKFEGGSDQIGGLLPEGWFGYPLRKSYAFPSEFMDILHMRPAGRSGAGHVETDE
jgi:NADH-quinone oxidoreductase subunit C